MKLRLTVAAVNAPDFEPDAEMPGRKLIKLHGGGPGPLKPWLARIAGRIVGMHARSRADAQRQFHHLRNRDDFDYADKIDVTRRQQRARQAAA